MGKYSLRIRSKTATIVMEEERKKLEVTYQKLNVEEDSNLKRWNE